MELNNIIAKLAYNIEPKPEGGFIARASDPSFPPLEAATREELLEKIQARVGNAIAAAIPGWKLPAGTKDLKFAFQLEPNPGGGYVAQSIGPDGKPQEGPGNESVAERAAEKVATALGECLLRQFPEGFENLKSKDVKVLFDVKTAGTPFKMSMTGGTGIFSRWGKAGDNSPVQNSPIQPEMSSAWPIIRFLLKGLAIVALLYFFFHHLHR